MDGFYRLKTELLVNEYNSNHFNGLSLEYDETIGAILLLRSFHTTSLTTVKQTTKVMQHPYYQYRPNGEKGNPEE